MQAEYRDTTYGRRLIISTGVDVPRLQNIVFFRYLKSPILFYQMLGRGTRLDAETGKVVIALAVIALAVTALAVIALAGAAGIVVGTARFPQQRRGRRRREDMPMTREEYIAIGDEFASRSVLAQLDGSIDLAVRDATLLATCGWTPRDTGALRALRSQLLEAVQAFERKFGQDVGRTRTTSGEMDNGKVWRLRARAILENGLTSNDALAELHRLGGAAGRNPDTLATQVEGLARIARAGETALRSADLVDDAFFAEGARLVEALRAAAVPRRQRPKNLSAEHDRLDELDGRAWEIVKRLNRSGRAAQLGNGDRTLAAQYNLDALYGRPLRIRRPEPVEPTAAGAAGSPA